MIIKVPEESATSIFKAEVNQTEQNVVFFIIEGQEQMH
jgi:hypothetical protein